MFHFQDHLVVGLDVLLRVNFTVRGWRAAREEQVDLPPQKDGSTSIVEP
jgi:hypothetical protein